MRLIDADELKEDLRRYFTEGVLDGVSARLAFNQILHDIDNAPTVEITETEIQKVLNKRCMTVVTNEHFIRLQNNYLEGYKKGLEDGKIILFKAIMERLEEKKRRGSCNEEDQGQ